MNNIKCKCKQFDKINNLLFTFALVFLHDYFGDFVSLILYNNFYHIHYI